jgi:flagellar hook-length control protein FliK
MNTPGLTHLLFAPPAPCADAPCNAPADSFRQAMEQAGAAGRQRKAPSDDTALRKAECPGTPPAPRDADAAATTAAPTADSEGGSGDETPPDGAVKTPATAADDDDPGDCSTIAAAELTAALFAADAAAARLVAAETSAAAATPAGGPAGSAAGGDEAAPRPSVALSGPAQTPADQAVADLPAAARASSAAVVAEARRGAAAASSHDAAPRPAMPAAAEVPVNEESEAPTDAAAPRIVELQGDRRRQTGANLRAIAPATATPAQRPPAAEMPAAPGAARDGAAVAITEFRPEASLLNPSPAAARAEPAAFAVALPHAAAGGGPEAVRSAVPTPIGQPAFAQDFGQRVVLLATGGVRSAELALNPAELGPLRVSIEVRGQDASVVFTAGAAATRTAIEEALPRLREMFAQQGLNLADASVGAQVGQQGNGTQPRARRGERAVGDAPAAPTAIGEVGAPSARPARLIDVIV